jgi:hypothetical protein
MGLSTKYSSKSTKKFMPGVFINDVTIVDIEVIYGGTEWQKEKYKDDVGINVTIDIGRDFQPKFYTGGRFKKDEFGEKVGEGTLRRLDIFFDAIDVDAKVDDEDKIPEDVLPDCRGRVFKRLSYVKGTKKNGKPSYADFQTVAAPESQNGELVAEFKLNLEKGWIKNYKPELMEESDELADW